MENGKSGFILPVECPLVQQPSSKTEQCPMSQKKHINILAVFCLLVCLIFVCFLFCYFCLFVFGHIDFFFLVCYLLSFFFFLLLGIFMFFCLTFLREEETQTERERQRRKTEIEKQTSCVGREEGRMERIGARRGNMITIYCLKILIKCS